MVRTRYAPSPTGFMTIGNLRTALYEYLIAKRNGGVYILRIEDTDKNRYVSGSEDAIYETLKLTGLTFDEGPGVGGDYGPYVQSQRKNLYTEKANLLVETGKAYLCFCDKTRLDSLSDERGLKKYDRACLSLSEAEINEKKTLGVPFVIRQLIPGGSTTFHDEVFGDITIENEEMEDQILIKSDGMPTYNFANVIDDHSMDITHIVRGSEYLTSTPKYKLLYEAFGWNIPAFVHLPLLQNKDGQKISKRHGDSSILELIKMGFLPKAIINYAALLGWSPRTDAEIYTLDELLKIFEPKHISKSPSTFDMVKLTWINGEHIKRMTDDEFFELAKDVLKEKVTKENVDYKYLASITKSRVSFVHEAGELVDFIDELPDYNIEMYTNSKLKTDPVISLKALNLALDAFSEISVWNEENINVAMNNLASNFDKKGQLLWPVRTALSGKQTTPCGAGEISLILGKEESLNRIKVGINKLNDGVR